MVYLSQRNIVRKAGEPALTRLEDKEETLQTSASSVAVLQQHAGGKRETRSCTHLLAVRGAQARTAGKPVPLFIIRQKARRKEDIC